MRGPLCMSALFICVLLQTPAVAQSCEQLYAQRNAIFKGAGYCFGTPRGIRHFGNAGCQYDRQADVPLSDNDRNRIAAIRRAERARGC
jgi:hypothetical protein